MATAGKNPLNHTRVRDPILRMGEIGISTTLLIHLIPLPLVFKIYFELVFTSIENMYLTVTWNGDFLLST